MPGKSKPYSMRSTNYDCTGNGQRYLPVSIGGGNGHFRLNVFKPVMIFNFFTQRQVIGDGCVSFNDKCAFFRSCSIGSKHKSMNNSLMVTSLNTKIGYYKAAEMA
jgi:fumarate hydratase class II